MSNSEFQTTTVVESKNPSADVATIGANTAIGGMIGLNPNIVTARGVMISQDTRGGHTATMIDYNAQRETPLVVTERTIAEAVHERLAASFDQISSAISG